MVNVNIDLIECTLDMTGHAGAAEEGQPDLVCCACSTAAQWLLYSLEELKERTGKIEKITYSMDKGEMHIKVRPKEYGRISTRARLQYAIECFEMLEDAYPDKIHMNTGKEDE